MQGIFSSPNQYIGWDHINRFNPAKTLCMSQARTWISNIVCRGLFCIQWVQMRGDCCWGERWLLLRWEMIVVEVRDDCCWGERWLFVLLILVELFTVTVLIFFIIIMKSRYIIHRSDYEKYHSCIRERTAFRADFSIHLLITRFICGKRIFFGHLIQYYL